MILKSGKMGRRAVILIIVFLILIVLGGILSYFVFFGKSKTSSERSGATVSSGGGGKALVNPAAGLSIEEAVNKFDESFVFYILVNIKAYNLHPPMFGSDTPKIEFYVGNALYNSEIVEGKIKVGKGEIADKDIIIWTSAVEAVKMVQDSNYISESFKSGASKVELIAGNIELASKGYISLYNELAGSSA